MAKHPELSFVCFMLLHGFVAALNCSSPTGRALFQELEKNVFPEKLLRPVHRYSDPLFITIAITVVGILGVNEKAQTLTTVLWQVMEWDIAGLSWDEEECGTARVSVPREKLWIPDMHIAEFMSEDESPKTPYVYLYNTGRVYDDKPIRVVSSCRLLIYSFPFDVQNCSLTFGSYMHYSTDIVMIQGSSAAEILEESRSVITTKGEWELADIIVGDSTLTLEEGSYSEVVYHVILRRVPTLYVVNLIIPSSFLVALDLFSFLLPPQSVDRSSFKMTLILGYTVFLLIVNDLLPATGETTPLINIFFSVSLTLMVTSVLATVFITNIQSSSSRYRTAPHWIRVLVLKYLAAVLCFPRMTDNNPITVYLNPPREPAVNVNIISSNIISSNLSGEAPSEKSPADWTLDVLQKLSRDLAVIRQQIAQHTQGNKSSEEWKMIGTVIDRLLFCLYILFIIVSFITIICIWTWNNTHAP